VEPTAEQVEAYRRDGFVVVEKFLPREEVERVRARWERLFKHEWETGIAPDEVNYTPGVTPADVTRQLCNAWKADRAVAATTLARRNAEFAGRLAGVQGLRINQDNLIWKPPRGKALLVHQDGSYLDWLAPPNMITCWMALDDTSTDTGTIYYARGSHRSGRGSRPGAASTPPATGCPTSVRSCPPEPSWTWSRSRFRPAAPRSTTPGSSMAARPTTGPTPSGGPSSAT